MNGANGHVYISVSLSGVIPASGVFVVVDDTDDGTGTVPGTDLIANFDFQNGPDSIVLRDGADMVLGALGYGDFPAGTFFAGAGCPAPDLRRGSESRARPRSGGPQRQSA